MTEPGLRWTSGEESRQGFDPNNMLVGSVVRYTGWMGFLRQHRVDGIQYGTPEEAQAVVEAAWRDEQDTDLERRIADLDAGG